MPEYRLSRRTAQRSLGNKLPERRKDSSYTDHVVVYDTKSFYSFLQDLITKMIACSQSRTTAVIKQATNLNTYRIYIVSRKERGRLNPGKPGKGDGSSSYYSETIDAFMKKASSPKIVSKQIIEAFKSTSTTSECFFRYTVGKDSKSLAAAKKYMSDFQLYEYVANSALNRI